MATLLAESSMNFTDASWKVINAATFKNNFAATTTVSTTQLTSVTATPGAITVEGILLWVTGRSATAAGTFTLQLFNSTLASVVNTVTITTNDIPSTTTFANSLLYFKFNAPVTLTAGQLYSIRLQSSTTSNTVTVYRSATANDFTFNYVLSTTAAPASTDIIWLSSPFTGATTPSYITITYNQTGTTNYNSLAVTSYANLFLENLPNKDYYLGINSQGVAGNGLSCFGNGIFRFGTSGSPVDSSSRLIINLASGGANFNGIQIQGISSEFSLYGKPITRAAKLTANIPANSTNLFTTDVVTNWSSSTTGDLIVLGSSTRGTSAFETRTVTGSTGTTVAVSGNITTAKSGTLGTQTPVIYLGGNAIISGSTTTNTINIRQQHQAKLYLSNVGMYFMGSATANFRGLMIEGVANSECIIDSCSFWNNNVNALILPLTTTNNFVIKDCVGAINLSIPAVTSTNTQVISGCTFVGGTNQAITTSFSSINTMFYNNTFNGGNATGTILTYNPAFTTLRTTPSIYNIEIGAAPGVALSYAATNALMSGITIWNCNSTGLSFATVNTSLQEGINLNVYGSTTANVGFTAAGVVLPHRFTNCRFGAETYGAANVNNVQFTTPVIYNQSTSQTSLIFDSCVIGNSTLPASNADVVITNAGSYLPNVLFDNCTLGSTNRFNISTPTLANGSRIQFQKIGGNVNQHRTYYRNGYILSDTTIVDTSPVSMRCVPESATNSLVAPLFKVNVGSGQTITITAKVRKSVVGDGAAYNGSQPYLAILQRSGNGFSGLTYTGLNTSNSFVVDEFATIATATNAANGNWQTLTWTSPTATDNTALDFYVFCNGTTGWVNWDTIRVT